jgi:hypothetical protein
MYAAFSALHEAGIDHRGATVAVQGFGKVGGLAAQYLHDAGCTVVAVSDVKGGVYSSKGLNPAALLRHLKEGSESVVGYPGTDTITNDELIELDVDVLVPAALEGVIHEENADRVKAYFVVEGANGPTTPDADAILEGRNVRVVPDVLANAGGVAVSYFEWVQDLQAYFWSEDEVTDRLKLLMERAYAEVSTLSKERGVSLRTAAQMIGVGRVADAHRTRASTRSTREDRAAETRRVPAPRAAAVPVWRPNYTVVVRCSRAGAATACRGGPMASAPLPAPSAEPASAGGLSEREREILAFERQWWKYAGAKETAIRDLFGMSATRYYQVLNALIDRPDALVADPMLVKRLRRLRATRQRTRSARRLGMDV